MADALKLTPAQRRQAQAELDKHGGDRSAAAIALLGMEWSTRQIGAALERSPSWVRQQVHGRPADPPRRTVRCACGWVGKRAGDSPTATPCPECGKRPEVMPTRQPKAAERMRVNAYVDADTHARLVEAGNGHPSTAAAFVLARWARSKVRTVSA